ncbi:MAG: bifunctional folylpolyglutamate synthase/dihydrofolate synthase, partial [Flavobacteriales bacterium]|nr:bifunctional folylpolyglutamate synthase/dihydrofolate synthase [Flavobacteriales bacterium]
SSSLPARSGLLGPHQERNARTAVATIEVLRERGWAVPDKAVAKGLERVVANTGLLGRWQVLAEPPLTIADVAHNVDGLRAVRRMLECTPYERLHVVLGVVNDKDPGRVLAELPKDATYYFCKADIPRGMEATELQAHAQEAGLAGTVYGSVREAYQAARSHARLNDLVLVTGSVFVVAEVL